MKPLLAEEKYFLLHIRTSLQITRVAPESMARINVAERAVSCRAGEMDGKNFNDPNYLPETESMWVATSEELYI